MSIGSLQGIPADIFCRLPDWQFHDACIAVHTRTNEEARALLRQLPDLQAVNSELVFEGGGMSRLTRELGRDLAALSDQLRLSVDIWALNDEYLSMAVGLGRRLRSLRAESLRLTSDEHAGSHMVWEHMDVKDVDVGSLYKLPRPATVGGRGFVVMCKSLDFTQIPSEVRVYAHAG